MIPVMLIPLIIKIAGYAIDYGFKKLNELPTEKAAPAFEKVRQQEEKKKAKIKEEEFEDDIQW